MLAPAKKILLYMDTPLNLAVHCFLYDDNDLPIHAQIINAFTFKH